MTVDKLDAALHAVNWTGDVETFLNEIASKEKLAAYNLRLAIWSKQFEQVDRGNAALTFVREMQSAGQMIVALTALALYKPAAGSIRTVIETALYYTYFRTHHTELATLLRDEEYFIDKNDIIEFHKRHGVNFKILQEKVGLLNRLKTSYSSLSAIIHGQIPGVWTTLTSLSKTAPNHKTLEKVVRSFAEGEEVVHRLFLCTVAQSFWDDFSPDAKKALHKGLPGDTKALLTLDE